MLLVHGTPWKPEFILFAEAGKKMQAPWALLLRSHIAEIPALNAETESNFPATKPRKGGLRLPKVLSFFFSPSQAHTHFLPHQRTDLNS